MGQGDHASENIGREYLDDNERHLFCLYFNTYSGKSQVAFLLYLELYLILGRKANNPIARLTDITIKDLHIRFSARIN